MYWAILICFLNRRLLCTAKVPGFVSVLSAPTLRIPFDPTLPRNGVGKFLLVAFPLLEIGMLCISFLVSEAEVLVWWAYWQDCAHRVRVTKFFRLQWHGQVSLRPTVALFNFPGWSSCQKAGKALNPSAWWPFVASRNVAGLLVLHACVCVCVLERGGEQVVPLHCPVPWRSAFTTLASLVSQLCPFKREKR
ncbi:hypothetical protein TRVL_02958 [Trypanosoma vivax]|uniref:Uncharacterized protein n=1 Tax=Trypanosoma vivax (strain Y486) TaxID=1055687 RepID=G0U6Z7_TRYVY|nr:hypothetical protein TRVL_02958 [Trypanosoma vivax]CCC51654.1 hypothetical protein TVY486_1007010 [Trypanosoma vivax Y486]